MPLRKEDIERIVLWKRVTGFEDVYEISDSGLLRNHRTGRIRKPQSHKDGYQLVVLHHNTRKSSTTIHRLVATHFVENPNNYPMVNHRDLDKANNDHTNLEWCTHLMNMQHAFANRFINSGGHRINPNPPGHSF